MKVVGSRMRVKTSGLLLAAFIASACLQNLLCQSAFAQSSSRKASEFESFVQSGTTALQRRQNEKAQADFKLALALLPPDHPDQAARVDVILLLAQSQMATSELGAARDLLEKNWQSILSHPDPERTDRANYFLMSIYTQLADHVSAEKYAGALVQRYEERFGKNHPQTLDSRLNHGTSLIGMGKEKQGNALLAQTFDVMEAGADAATYQTRLNMVSSSLEASGKLSSAARYYERLIASLEKQPASRELGVTYFNLAFLRKNEKRLEVSLALHEKAIDILAKTAGPNDIDTIAAVSGLGNTYTLLGRPASGVQFLEQAFQRGRKLLGDNHNETWMYGNNYANALRDLERFDEALVIDQAAYDWRTSNLPPNAIPTEISTLNLGLDWMGLKQFEKAEEKFNELYASRLKRLGPQDPATEEAAKFVSLALSYNPRKVATKDIPKRDIAKLDRLTANIFAGALDQQGKPKEAIKYHRRAFEASISETGAVDPTTLLMLRNLALSESQLRPNGLEEVKLYEDLARRTLAWARTEVAATAGQARSEDIRRVANRMIYDVIKLAQANPQAHHVLFQVLMDWKGLGTTEQALLNQLRSQPPNAAATQLVQKLDELQKRLRSPNQSPDQLQAEISLAEIKLAEISTSFGRSRAEAAITPRDVIAQLRPDEALIDFVIGDRILNNSTAVEQEVFALVTLSDGRAIVKELGKLEAIKAIISKPGYEADSANRRKLFDLLLQPVLKMKSMAQRKHYYIVPDGELFLVPFEGLLNAEERAFAEVADVTLMRSSTGLLQAETPPGKRSRVLLVGAPDYGSGQGDITFPALPDALREVSAIHATAKDSGFQATLVTASAASEPAIRAAVAGQNIVHMATHGFFLARDNTPALEPPWRGGLALSGANAATPKGLASDDGIAYAAELANWPLDKAELVVLSACETASGERSYVEGLRGIPAALATSGAKRSLLAYWGVPDEGAANFMTAFYDHLLGQGMTYEEAFRETKRDAIAGRVIGADAPEVWQAFVMMRN